MIISIKNVPNHGTCDIIGFVNVRPNNNSNSFGLPVTTTMVTTLQNIMPRNIISTYARQNNMFVINFQI